MRVLLGSEVGVRAFDDLDNKKLLGSERCLATTAAQLKAIPLTANFDHTEFVDAFGVVQAHVGDDAMNSEILGAAAPRGDSEAFVFQHIGGRTAQEDRFLVAPQVVAPENASDHPFSLYGVFDGAVSDFASERASRLFVPKLVESPSWRLLQQGSTNDPREQAWLLQMAVGETYHAVDTSVLGLCAEEGQDYAATTACTLMVAGDLLAIAHLGDSRIILGIEGEDGALVGRQMTVDHAPDSELERQRIYHCGGSVFRLPSHNNRAFLRGGDFLARKARGEKPVQMMFSRGFGGKDLKRFGMSGVPDVIIVPRSLPDSSRVRWAVIGSDGLWDKLSSQDAVDLAHEAMQVGENPSEVIVRHALSCYKAQAERADNITAICVRLD